MSNKNAQIKLKQEIITIIISWYYILLSNANNIINSAWHNCFSYFKKEVKFSDNKKIETLQWCL
jgi:hypothetical protein